MTTPISPAGQEPNDRSADFREEPDREIEGHHYDGIKEYDNPMPGWWVWIFIVTIVWSVVYVAGVHFLGFINTYEDDLARSQEQLTLIREAYAEANQEFEPDAGTLAAFALDPARVERGAAHYASLCAACHGDQGEGLIGPNLVDPYWVFGGTDADIYHIVSVGVPEKGMPAWDRALSPEGRAEVVAFIRSIQGTDPPNQKMPEGVFVASEQIDGGGE
jgi:cytochrome c oxidase cbb3-type subunit III